MDEDKIEPEGSKNSELPGWLTQRHVPSEEERGEWAAAGHPDHVDIIGGFLATNNFVYGLPSKEEIFRFDDLRQEAERDMFAPATMEKEWLRVWYVRPSPLPIVNFVHASPPFGITMGTPIEVNYNVRLQGLLDCMHLQDIKVISGSKTDDDPKVVFEATELPGAFIRRRLRVVRICVHTEGFGTWETMAEITYPGGPGLGL